MVRFELVALLLSVSLAAGCSSAPLSTPDPTDASPSVDAAELTQIYRPHAKVPLSATSLAFNASADDELWVALRQFPSGQPCTKDLEAGCSALPGAMAVIGGATGGSPQAALKEDGNAWHFMRRPTALAWGNAELFASCGEALTDNYEDEAIPYSGPVLWSSAPSLFGVEPKPGQNGTHLDMLHETPYCMGIAHETGNAFWTFNGDAGSLDRVDFHAPHEPGGEDHSDGEVHRYVAGELSRSPEVPSHLAYDEARHLVYVADTGHGRVLRVDPNTAQPGADITVYEPLASSGRMDGASVTELSPPGRLLQPSGLALDGDTLYVTDNASGLIYVFDVEGNVQRVLDTGLGAGALGGIALGPDRKLYLADLSDGSVHRVDSP